jgi:hypothetical protein
LSGTKWEKGGWEWEFTDTKEEAMVTHPTPPFPSQRQPMPGHTSAMQPVPDHGEKSYRGSGRLLGKKAIITGGDSG